jgi:hypothetical protein
MGSGQPCASFASCARDLPGEVASIDVGSTHSRSGSRICVAILPSDGEHAHGKWQKRLLLMGNGKAHRPDLRAAPATSGCRRDEYSASAAQDSPVFERCSRTSDDGFRRQPGSRQRQALQSRDAVFGAADGWMSGQATRPSCSAKRRWRRAARRSTHRSSYAWL